MLGYLRARAFSSGFLGGSRLWIVIGAVVWTIRFFQWLVRPETEVIYRDQLGPGQSVTIRHGDPVPGRRQRKNATRQRKADVRTARRAERRGRRQGVAAEAV